MLQFVIHADMIFPDEIVGLRRLGIHLHGGALKVLDQVVVIDAWQLLNEPLVKMFARLRLAAFREENKILHLPGMNGLVGEVLLDDHHRRKNQHGHGEERVTIPADEWHRDFIVEQHGNRNAIAMPLLLDEVVSRFGAVVSIAGTRIETAKPKLLPSLGRHWAQVSIES